MDGGRQGGGLIAEPMWRQVAGGALVVFGVLILAALIRYLLRELLRAAGLGATDRFFGALFGIARGLVFAFVVVMALFLWLVDKTIEFTLYDLILGWKK